VLDSFCRNMTGKRIDSLIIDGHTDNTGTDAFNDRLSLGRAASVASYFKSCPVLSKVVIIVRGWGSKQPVAPNNTPAGRQQNRRVQLSLYFRE
jgi:outer membrane protein OmpA-like peptidoglycan-associated protein